jgi:hypothetical protein
MSLSKIYVIIIAIVLVAVAIGGIFLVRDHYLNLLSKSSSKNSSGLLSPGYLNITVDKTIDDSAYAQYLIKQDLALGSEGSALINASGLSLNNTRMLYNLTITYHGVGTTYFAFANIQIHTTEGNATEWNFDEAPVTSLFGSNVGYVELSNGQSMSGQIAGYFNTTASVTSISVQSAVQLQNVSNGYKYNPVVIASTSNIPGVSSYLSVLSQYTGVETEYPNVTLDGNQIDCKISGWTSASGVAVTPLNISDPFSHHNGSVLLIYTGQTITEDLNVTDSNVSNYFVLDTVSGNIEVSVNNLPLSTQANGYLNIIVTVIGPRDSFTGPLVINFAGNMHSSS